MIAVDPPLAAELLRVAIDGLLRDVDRVAAGEKDRSVEVRIPLAGGEAHLDKVPG